MTVSQFEADKVPEGDQASFSDGSSKKFSTLSVGLQSRRNPPARNTSRFWFERFLAVIQRQNPAIIDASFLSQIAPSNEGKLLAQLKFLGVIDEQGKPTRILPMLNMVGDQQKKAFQEIASEAYRDLESEVKMERAVPDDVVNFFIRKYSFTRDKAINAAKFYLYLVEKSGNPVSSELGSFLTEKIPAGVQSTASPSQSIASGRVSERIPVKGQLRDLRTSGSNSRLTIQRKGKAFGVPDEMRAPIQAIISIKLEKDTPKEFWDRVLALLGEKQSNEVAVESNEKIESDENLDRELSADSAFT